MIFEHFLNLLRTRVPEGEFILWFSDLELQSFQNGVLSVITPGEMGKARLEKQYKSLLISIAEELTGEKVSLIVHEGSFHSLNDSMAFSDKPKTNNQGLLFDSPQGASTKKNTLNNSNLELDKDSNNSLVMPSKYGRSSGEYSPETNTHRAFSSQSLTNNTNLTGLSPTLSFDRYVAHPQNQLAYDVANKIIYHHGLFNPVFIFGAVGTGKTHLLHAIGNHYRINYPMLKIRYISPNEMTQEYVKALQSKNDTQFRLRYKTLDLLILDDIQFLINKEKTSEEFFHIFNEIYQAGKQMVFASDRPPAELDGLDERLKSRLSSSLVLEIEKPQVEARKKLLEFYITENGIKVDKETILYLAEHLPADIRSLIGAVRTMLFHSSLYKVAIDIPFCIKNIEILKTNSVEGLTAEQILNAVATHGKISISDLRSPKKSRNIAQFRQIAMYLLRKHTELSFSEIGAYLGGKNGSSIHTGVARVEKLIDEDNHFGEIIKSILVGKN